MVHKRKSVGPDEILRQAIKESDYGMNGIARRSHVDRNSVRKFRRKTHDITLTTAMKIGTGIGLELAIAQFLRDADAVNRHVASILQSAKRQIWSIGARAPPLFYATVEAAIKARHISYYRVIDQNQKISHKQHQHLRRSMKSADATVLYGVNPYSCELIAADDELVLFLPGGKMNEYQGLCIRGYNPDLFSVYSPRASATNDVCYRTIESNRKLTELCESCARE